MPLDNFCLREWENHFPKNEPPQNVFHFIDIFIDFAETEIEKSDTAQIAIEKIGYLVHSECIDIANHFKYELKRLEGLFCYIQNNFGSISETDIPEILFHLRRAEHFWCNVKSTLTESQDFLRLQDESRKIEHRRKRKPKTYKNRSRRILNSFYTVLPSEILSVLNLQEN